MLTEFIKDLREAGIEIRYDGERLICDAPKGAMTESLASEIRQRKEAIISFLKETNAQEPVEPVLASVPRSSSLLPVTPAQERLLFIEQLEPGNTFFNLAGAFRLTGVLDVSALRQSLNEIMRRHEALSATFHWEEGRPVQQIKPFIDLTIKMVSFRNQPQEERESKMIAFLEKEADLPFNLQEGPPVRALLVELTEAEHVLMFTAHHLIWDGWSFDIFLSELKALYESNVKGYPSQLPDLPFQYADYAVWYRQWMSGERLQRELDYWHEQLKGELTVLQTPVDHPRPPRMTYEGAREWFSLSKDTLDSLTALGRNEGATPYMVLLAAFKILLHRYTGQEDILIGSPIQGRTRPEIENLIGFFVNTLVLRTHVESSLSFREVLARVRNVCLGAYSHPHAPFDVLVNEHEQERDASRTPLTQTFFTYQDTATRNPKMADITVRSVIRGTHQVESDLGLWVRNYGDRLDGAIDYRTDLFDSTTIRRMLNQYETILKSILAEPDRKISRLNILPHIEREQLITGWNDTYRGWDTESNVLQLFEAQVRKSPDATAVIFKDQQLTYKELSSRANQLAHFLRSHDIGCEVLVGLCTHRSIDMIVGMLGILKAGGAYLPLDPTYPKERLAYMLEDGQVPLLLTQKGLVDRLPEYHKHMVCLDTEWESIAKHSDANPCVSVAPDNLAYVIYTSGSTGNPKGVMIPHRALANLTQVAIQEYELSSRDRVLQFASPGFDASVEEIFPCLVVGGGLVLRTEKMLNSVPSFLQGCRDYEITVLDLPTAYWHQLASELAKTLDMALPDTVRVVVIGGEEVSAERVALWRKIVGDYPRLINSYGPTETTVTATMYEVCPSGIALHDNGNNSIKEHVADTRLPAVPIGRPLSTHRAYLLDSHLQPVPIGVPGELYIGGGCVARGYLNRPELTAQKFVPDPFSDEQGARLYKSGDLARYLPDGNLIFLGRIDNQVKLRGFRIELGEIEEILSRYPMVKEVCVRVIETMTNDKRLVAYVVPVDGSSVAVSEILSYLKTKLPPYMIPQHVVEIDALPLSPNGKVDTDSLPLPATNLVADDEEYVAPETEMEKLIAEIWQAVLGVERVGIHDNFFEAGGHSLLSMQVIAQIDSQTGVRLDPFVFVTENLGQIAAKCEIYISDAQSGQKQPDAIVHRLLDRIKGSLLRTGS